MPAPRPIRTGRSTWSITPPGCCGRWAVPTDPRRLRPGALCRLLNSTPLGAVLSEAQLRRHRSRAGLRIGEGQHLDLLRYVAWLVLQRHAPRPAANGVA